LDQIRYCPDDDGYDNDAKFAVIEKINEEEWKLFWKYKWARPSRTPIEPFTISRNELIRLLVQCESNARMGIRVPGGKPIFLNAYQQMDEDQTKVVSWILMKHLEKEISEMCTTHSFSCLGIY